jgi:hypothetical protein
MLAVTNDEPRLHQRRECGEHGPLVLPSLSGKLGGRTCFGGHEADDREAVWVYHQLEEIRGIHRMQDPIRATSMRGRHARR